MISRDDDHIQQSSAASRPALPSRPRQLGIAENHPNSRELFAGSREIIIAFGEETHLTAQNTLILT